MMDEAMKEACRFYAEHFEGMESLAPKKFSPEEQHALSMLAAYIRARACEPVGTERSGVRPK